MHRKKKEVKHFPRESDSTIMNKIKEQVTVQYNRGLSVKLSFQADSQTVFQHVLNKICRSLKAHLYIIILNLSDGNHGQHTAIPHHVSLDMLLI